MDDYWQRLADATVDAMEARDRTEAAVTRSMLEGMNADSFAEWFMASMKEKRARAELERIAHERAPAPR
jgi:hypothetical protein